MNAAKANANVKCPCGQPLKVPFVGFVPSVKCVSEFDIMSVKCPKCGRIAAGGNARTGQITSWMTPAQVNQANDEYAAQAFSADMNEFCGRGEW